ncbi:MAG: restriction endonuclease [Betaproteobacteria bacterium]|nr:restriction endonuclease [Betaproteobacteria bacterium]
MIDVEALLGKAVQQFWKTRSRQKLKQGFQSGRKDAGDRAAVTGGKHTDGFVELVAAIVNDAGLPEAKIHTAQKKRRTLPGHFRPTKEWDVVVVSGSDLVAVVEVKSQVGSFGNNFNNRVEEALGNATDFWTAYRKGAFSPSQRPWLGYLFMLEENAKSLRPTKRIELSPFKVDAAFQGLSYAERYELVCERLVRELHYDAACLFTSDSKGGLKGTFRQPREELDIRRFAISLHARAAAFARLQG